MVSPKQYVNAPKQRSQQQQPLLSSVVHNNSHNSQSNYYLVLAIKILLILIILFLLPHFVTGNKKSQRQQRKRMELQIRNIRWSCQNDNIHHKQQQCCAILIPEESLNCVNQCISPTCYDAVYSATNPLEDGEVDILRAQQFESCVIQELREIRKQQQQEKMAAALAAKQQKRNDHGTKQQS